MHEKTIRTGVSAGGLPQAYQKEDDGTLGRPPEQKGGNPQTEKISSADLTELNSLLQEARVSFQGGIFRSGIGVEGRVETNPVLVAKDGIGELKKFLKDWEVLKNETNFDAKTGQKVTEGWKNHLEERIKVLKVRKNELLVDWANQNPGVSAKIGIPESEIHFPELEEVREFLRQAENRLQEFQSLSEVEIKTPKILSGKFQQFLELDASIIAWFLKYQIRAVEKIPVEGDLKETGFLSDLVKMVNSTSDWEGRVSGYEKIFAQVEREGLRRAMLGRAYYFGKMMQKPIDRIDWIFQKSIDFVTLGSDLTEVKVQPLAPEYEAMAGKYREMAAKLDDLSVTVESVQKNFSEFELKHADAIKKLEEQFKSEMFYSSLSIVIVSAGVGTIAEAVVAPLLARAGLSALALEGSGAETTAAVLRLVASQGGAAVNAFGFTLASRALTNKIQGDGSFLLINPKKSLLTNFAEIGTETVGMYLMCKWLGLALGKYMNTVDGMLMARAEKNVAKLGIEQGSAAYYEALVKEVGQLSEKNWLQFGVKIGGFVTEYAALNVWDLAKLTLASEEEKKNFNLSDHALESLKFLIGLKIGNKLVSPLTVPMHEWAQQRALAPYKTELDTLDQQIQSAQELLQQGPEKVGQALEEMTQALEQKLALYKQIPEGIRNKKEQAEVEHNLRILQAVLAKDKNQLSENQPENREVAASAERVVPVQYGRDDSGPVLIPPEWKPLPEGFSEEKLNVLLSEVRTSTIDPQKWNNYPSPVPERILHSLLRENSANLETMNQLAQIILERVRRGEKIDSETAFGGLWQYSNKTLNPLKKIALQVLSFQFEKSEKEKGEQNRASGIMTLGGEEVWTAAFFKNFLNHETIDQDLQLIVDVAQRIEDPSRREVFVRWMKFLGSFVSVWDKPKVEKVMADLGSQKVASTSSPLTSIATALGLGGAVSLLEGCLNTVSQNAPEVGQAMDAAAQQSGSLVWPWLVGAATLLGLAGIGYEIHQKGKKATTETPQGIEATNDLTNLHKLKGEEFKQGILQLIQGSKYDASQIICQFVKGHPGRAADILEALAGTDNLNNFVQIDPNHRGGMERLGDFLWPQVNQSSLKRSWAKILTSREVASDPDKNEAARDVAKLLERFAPDDFKALVQKVVSGKTDLKTVSQYPTVMVESVLNRLSVKENFPKESLIEIGNLLKERAKRGEKIDLAVAFENVLSWTAKDRPVELKQIAWELFVEQSNSPDRVENIFKNWFSPHGRDHFESDLFILKQVLDRPENVSKRNQVIRLLLGEATAHEGLTGGNSRSWERFDATNFRITLRRVFGLDPASHPILVELSEKQQLTLRDLSLAIDTLNSIIEQSKLSLFSKDFDSIETESERQLFALLDSFVQKNGEGNLEAVLRLASKTSLKEAFKNFWERITNQKRVEILKGWANAFVDPKTSSEEAKTLLTLLRDFQIYSKYRGLIEGPTFGFESFLEKYYQSTNAQQLAQNAPVVLEALADLCLKKKLNTKALQEAIVVQSQQGKVDWEALGKWGRSVGSKGAYAFLLEVGLQGIDPKDGKTLASILPIEKDKFLSEEILGVWLQSFVPLYNQFPQHSFIKAVLESLRAAFSSSSKIESQEVKEVVEGLLSGKTVSLEVLRIQQVSGYYYNWLKETGRLAAVTPENIEQHLKQAEVIRKNVMDFKSFVDLVNSELQSPESSFRKEFAKIVNENFETVLKLLGEDSLRSWMLKPLQDILKGDSLEPPLLPVAEFGRWFSDSDLLAEKLKRIHELPSEMRQALFNPIRFAKISENAPELASIRQEIIGPSLNALGLTEVELKAEPDLAKRAQKIIGAIENYRGTAYNPSVSPEAYRDLLLSFFCHEKTPEGKDALIIPGIFWGLGTEPAISRGKKLFEDLMRGLAREEGKWSILSNSLEKRLAQKLGLVPENPPESPKPPSTPTTNSPLTSIATTLGLGGAVSLLEGCLNTVSQNAPEVGQAIDAAAQQSSSPVWPWLVGAATLLGLAGIGYKIHQSQKVTPTATPNKQTNQLAGETLDRVRSPQSIENSLPSKSLLLILKEALKGESYFDLLVKDAQQGENPGGRILRAFSPLLGKWGSGNSGYDRIDLELRLKKDFETLLLSRGDFSKVEEHEIAALENGLDVDLDLRLNLNGKVFSGRFSKANNRGEDLLVSDVKLNFESKEDRQLFYKTFYEKLKKNCEKLNMPEESYDGRYDEYQTSLLSFFQELFPSSSLEEIEKNHAWDSQKVMDWKVRPISIDSFIEWKAKPAIRRDDSFGFAIFRRRTREIGAAILKTLQEMGMEVRISRRQS